MTAGNGGAGSTLNGANGTVSDGGDGGPVYPAAGGGGVGWIRINTACGPVITADSGVTFISPNVGTMCTTFGTIKY
jgi:hypothetical protein